MQTSLWKKGLPPSYQYWLKLAQSSPRTAKLLATVTAPLLNKYIPHEPTPKQAAFLLLDHKEAFYGGAAGGGKSDAVLMAALQYVDVPGYAALILRRSYTDLALPEALMDRAHEWLNGTDAHWDQNTKTWTFPNGASLTFGYLATTKDKYRYASAAFQFIGFDESTQFPWADARFLFSRLRKPKQGPLSKVPLRLRYASNPGNIGHDWHKERFIDGGKANGRPFIPAKLEDNPYLDYESYVASLMELDPITRRQLLEGDWWAKPGGKWFQKKFFKVVESDPAEGRPVRFWDLAATDPNTNDTDPCWTVGVKLAPGRGKGRKTVLHVERFRKDPAETEARIKATIQQDGKGVDQVFEVEPGAMALLYLNHLITIVAKGYVARGRQARKKKLDRARPVASAAEARNIDVLEGGSWIGPFIDALEAVPDGGMDDCDALSGAFNELESTNVDLGLMGHSGQGRAATSKGSPL